MTPCEPLPKLTVNIISSSKLGSDSAQSTMKSMSMFHPRFKFAMIAKIKAMIALKKIAIPVIDRLCINALRVLLNMSLPNQSVPNQCK
ncbi:hypothetical protein D049_4810 [Vibrio parahaemolyticus VPTS-2010]|nr:hypothetical protein D049_4810 [Vibrio parahaemolyticus VPTS-2010]